MMHSMGSILFVCLSLGFLFASSAANNFVLPEQFEGTWFGSPDFNIMGPLHTYLFSISRAPDGDYLFEINLHYDSLMIGYQRFYVEGFGQTAGTLWYCGQLSNFSDSTAEQTGGVRPNAFLPVKFPLETDFNVTFCLDSSDKDVMGGALDLNPFMKGCVTCDCANWTLAYNPTTETLITQMSMGGSEGHTHSKHLWGELKKIGPPPLVNDSYMPGHGERFACNFSTGGRDSVPVERTYLPAFYNAAKMSAERATDGSASGCPFAKFFSKMGLSSKSDSSLAATTRAAQDKEDKVAKSSVELDHCYTLNSRSGYELAWTIDTVTQTLRCSVSAPVLTSTDGGSNVTYRNTTWVAIGFRPLSRSSELDLAAEGTGHHMNFGMQGADIVAGSVAGGVRTMYAALYTGPPTPDSSLQISDASVEVQPAPAGSGLADRVVLTFTRPLVGGYLLANYGNNASINTGFSDIIWAVGLDDSASDVGCSYHSNLRGLRVIDWENPQIAMVDAWKCK